MTEPLETMQDFFNTRAEQYDAQQVKNIDGGSECYRVAAEFLPPDTRDLLDLGCGTGLELESVFSRFPNIKVTGIDLAEKMLERLREKYAGHRICLINDSYFSTDLGQNRFDAAISVMSLHHFEADAKAGLYRKIYRSLRPGGVFLEGDYMICSDDSTAEMKFLEERRKLQQDFHLTEKFYHYDTPFTVKHEVSLMQSAGFSTVQRVWGIENNVMLLAKKEK